MMLDFNLSNFMPYRLNLLARTISRGLAWQYQEKYDLSIAQWRVLAHLSQHDKISIRDINKAVELDKVAVSRAVKELQHRKIIHKITNPLDKRLLLLSLSPSGVKMMQELIPLALEFEQKMLASLDVDDRQALDRIISKLMT